MYKTFHWQLEVQSWCNQGGSTTPFVALLQPTHYLLYQTAATVGWREYCGCLPNIITKTGGESHKYRTKLFSLCCYPSLAVHILRSIRSGSILSSGITMPPSLAASLLLSSSRYTFLLTLFKKWAKIRSQTTNLDNSKVRNDSSSCICDFHLWFWLVY